MSSEIKYIDISIAGNKRKGKFVYNNDALDNAFRLWISASKNEFLRRQGGNVLARHIGKPMNDNRVILIKQSIQKGIAEEFNPLLTVLSLKVTPNYTKRQYSIALVAYSEQFRVGVNQTYLISNEI